MITPSRKTMVDPNLNYSGCRYKMCEVLSLQTGNEVAGYNPLLLKTLITSTEEKKHLKLTLQNIGPLQNARVYLGKE